MLQMNLCRSGGAGCFDQGGTNPMAKAASDGGVQHVIAGGAFAFASSGKTSIPGTDHPAWRVTLTR